MQLTTSTHIFDYWESLRGSDPMPPRTAFRPAPISSMLPDLFILEWQAEDEVMFRLAGTKVCTLLGSELGGRAFSSVWTEEDAGFMPNLARQVASSATPVCLELSGLRLDHPPLTFEMVLLPVLDAEGKPSQIVGSIAAHHVSAWQLVEPIAQFRLEGIESLSMDMPPLDPEFDDNASGTHIIAGILHRLNTWWHPAQPEAGSPTETSPLDA